jgi:hypothetical protein
MAATEGTKCIYCGDADVPDGIDICPSCAFPYAVEVAEGHYRLGRYLARWAKFDEWLARTREGGTA